MLTCSLNDQLHTYASVTPTEHQIDRVQLAAYAKQSVQNTATLMQSEATGRYD